MTAHPRAEQAGALDPDRSGLAAPSLARAIAEEHRTVDAIIAALADAGIEIVVGMPGGLTLALWSALHEHPTIRAVQVRQEALGSYMAEAYGRLRGRPIAVMGQGEWIVGNAGQGLIEALLGSSPVVILTEMTDGEAFSHHAFYQTGTGDYGAWDAKGALAAVTKRVMVSHYPAQAVQHAQLAVKHATTGDPGPVAVVFSTASLRGFVGPDSQPRLFTSSSYVASPRAAVDVDGIAAAARAVRDARRPVIIAGNGVRVGQACASLEQLAETLDVPVVTTAGGKGVFSESDPRAGGVMGSFGWASANELVGGADLVLVVGSRLASSDTAEGNPALIDPTRQLVVQLDIEPLNAAWTTPAAIVITGDAGRLMDALRLALADKRGSWEPADRRVAAASGPAEETAAGESIVGARPLPPRQIIETLRRAVPPETIVTCDAGENRLFMMQWFAAGGAGAYLQPAAGGGMGYAVPAAMGAKLAHPDRPVLAVCGDGGFSMMLHGMMSAIEQELPICVAVLNNNALGWVLHGSRHPVAARFQEFDFAGISQAIGCDARRVSSLQELHDLATTVGALRRPLVIEIPTSLDTSFREVLQDLDQRRRETGY